MKRWLWRAVDQTASRLRRTGVLDILVQSRRDTRAAKRLLRKLLKKQTRPPCVMVTDKLASYGAAKSLCRRAEALKVPRPRPRRDGEPLHLLVDSTGLKLCGAGEWLVEKHGAKTRRSWRELHIGVDAGSGQIVAAALIAKEVDGGAEVDPLLDQMETSVASFTADGAYDQESVAAALAGHHPDAVIIVAPQATAVLSETAETAPTQRDRHLHSIAQHGRAAWQKASGYTKRARAEAATARFKQVIGVELRSRTDERRATEVDVAVHALNRMLELGRPISVRIA